MNKPLIVLALASMMTCLSAQAEKIAIVGGTIHTMGEQGTVKDKALLIDGQRIGKLVNPDAVPAGYRVIDAKGKVVTPGLIGAQTHLGLEEVQMSAGTVDASTGHSTFSPTGAAIDVSYAVNTYSSLINISRIEGVTSAATGMARTKGLFQGQGAVISLGDDKAEPIIKAHAFMNIDLSNEGIDENGGSRALVWPHLEEMLAEVATRHGKPLTSNDDWHGTLTYADVNALMKVANGDIPLMIAAQRVADIRQVIAFKHRHPKVHIVLLYAAEGWMVADEIAKANIPVILSPEESNLPYQFDQLGATLANAGRLANAGVTIAIGVETHNIRLATQEAGNAVANGLPWEDGLAALTINTAKIYGIDKDYGSLEPGKIADVVVWSGDPLEVMNAAEDVIIHGHQIKMESRQTKLRDRYLKRTKGSKVQYIRP